MNSPTSRRTVLKGILAAAAAGSLPLALPAEAAALPELAESDPMAKNMGYVANAAKIDAAKEATYKKGSTCSGCALYQAAQAANGAAPCGLFPGKSVKAGGWCRAWAAKPA